MKYLRVLAVALALTLGFHSVSLANDGLVRSVDSFDFLVDYSGSMMMKNTELKTNKIDLAKDVLGRINAAIPDLGYMGSMHTFAPAASLLPLGAWNPAAMTPAIDSLQNNLPVFGRLTPMGNGLAQLSSEYSQMARPTAVVMVSDGVSNSGIDPVAEAEHLYATQPGLCLHVLSVADTAEGQATLDRIAGLNGCAVQAKVGDLLADQAQLDKFVQDVFYHSTEEALVLRGVNFAFDSYTLDNQAMAVLNEVALMLRGTPDSKITLEGWTDSIGTDAYNKTLSQRRANAVRDYLVRQGVPGFSIGTIGRGESTKYDNSTADGRYLNRRTELLFN